MLNRAWTTAYTPHIAKFAVPAPCARVRGPAQLAKLCVFAPFSKKGPSPSRSSLYLSYRTLMTGCQQVNTVGPAAKKGYTTKNVRSNQLISNLSWCIHGTILSIQLRVNNALEIVVQMRSDSFVNTTCKKPTRELAQ